MYKNKVLLMILLTMYTVGEPMAALSSGEEPPTILLIGLELKDLAPDTRSKFDGFDEVVRPYMLPDKVKTLAKQVKPQTIVIRHPSGIYEYSADGSLKGSLPGIDSRIREQLTRNMQDGTLPRALVQEKLPHAQRPYSSEDQLYREGPSGPSIPFRISGTVEIGRFKPSIPPPNKNINNQNKTTKISSPIKQAISPSPVGGTSYLAPGFARAGGGAPGVYYDNMPYPGNNIPPQQFPGKSEYSYLSGEDERRPPYNPNVFRSVLRQTAGFAQNNVYPFWFDNFLSTNANLQNSAFNTSGSIDGFPQLQFNSNTTANAAIVGSQWISTGIGVGATVGDAILQGQQIKKDREAAQRDELGVPYYVQPQAASTYYYYSPNYRPAPSYPGSYK